MSPDDRTRTEDEELDELEDDDDSEFEEMLELDLLPVSEASGIARDITVEWIKSKAGSSTEEQIVMLYRSVYQAARFPTLADEEEIDEEDEDEETA